MCDREWRHVKCSFTQNIFDEFEANVVMHVLINLSLEIFVVLCSLQFIFPHNQQLIEPTVLIFSNYFDLDSSPFSLSISLF